MSFPYSQITRCRGQEEHAGFIFMCDRRSKPECYFYRVFGLPAGQIHMIGKIKPGDTLFLFDIDLKLLYGIYEATSVGKLNWQPGAFSGKFPAQVKFRICQDCLPVPESVFSHAIQDNYHGLKFDQKLSAEQVQALKLLFRPITLPTSTPVPSPHRNVMLRNPLASSHSHSPYASNPLIESRYEHYGQNGLAPYVQAVGGPQNTFAEAQVSYAHSAPHSQPQTHIFSLSQASYSSGVQMETLSCNQNVLYGAQYPISQHMNQSGGGQVESEVAVQQFVQHQPCVPSAVYTTSSNAQPLGLPYNYALSSTQHYYAPSTQQVSAPFPSYYTEPTHDGSSAVVQGHFIARSVQENGSSTMSGGTVMSHSPYSFPRSTPTFW